MSCAGVPGTVPNVPVPVSPVGSVVNDLPGNEHCGDPVGVVDGVGVAVGVAVAVDVAVGVGVAVPLAVAVAVAVAVGVGVGDGAEPSQVTELGLTSATGPLLCLMKLI